MSHEAAVEPVLPAGEHPRTLPGAERQAYMRALRAKPRRRHDWEKIKKQYVEGVFDPEYDIVRFPTLAELARLHKINLALLEQHSARYGWVAKRQALQRAVEEQVALRKARKLALARVHDDFEVHEVAGQGIALVRRRLARIRLDDDETTIARNAYFALKAAGAPVDELEATGYDPYAQSIDPRELTALSQALLGFQQASIRATGGIEATTRTEITGAGGGAVEVTGSVRTELTADSISRVEGLVEVIRRVQGELPPGEGDVVDGEVVEEGE